MGMDYNVNEHEAACLSNYLYTWLCGETNLSTQFVDGLIDKLSMFGKPAVSLPAINDDNIYPTGSQLNAEIFHGIEGKQQGVLRFLSLVAAQTKPCTLLLYSDENLEWLAEDKAFYTKWGALLMNVLSNGHRIKIIHTIDRDVSEVLAAINLWLPLYMTGAIEPFYYPKYREHVFRRTMFIAPDIAALTSTTLANQSNSAEQFFYTDRNMIDSLTEEFNAYLDICRPLMRVFTGNNANKFCEIQMEFEEQTSDWVSFSDTFSSLTIPEKMFHRLLNKTGVNEETKEKLLKSYKERIKAFKDNLKYTTYTDIVALPFPSSQATDTVFGPKDFFGEVNLCYSAIDYIEHLENIINLLKENPNYKLKLCEKRLPQNIYIAAKPDVGVIVAKNDVSPIIFAINNQTMTSAFNSYFEDLIKMIPPQKRSREHVFTTLQEFHSSLK
jgi:hypothetical protein